MIVKIRREVMSQDLMSYIEIELFLVLASIGVTFYIMLCKSRERIGFNKKTSKKLSYMKYKKWMFLIGVYGCLILTPIMGVNHYFSLKTSNMKCIIGHLSESFRDYSNTDMFKRFDINSITGDYHIFKSDSFIKTKEVLSPGKQTYMLYKGNTLIYEIYKMGYLEENIEVSELEETSKRLIEEYASSIDYDVFNINKIWNRVKKLYIMYLIFLVPGIVYLIKFIAFRLRYGDLIRRIKKIESSREGEVTHERSYSNY